MAPGLTSSPDLVHDARFHAIVNSVSPEFQSANSDSGVNKACYLMLTGYSGDGPAPPPIAYSTANFVETNLGAPTYGDVLRSDVPPENQNSGLKHIVHALAPDLSIRSKRLPSGLTEKEARAVLVSAYFRALWRCTAPGVQRIGCVPLGGGVFANKIENVREAFMLAYNAYVASGGTAEVSMVLWSPDGAEAKDHSEWDAVISGSKPEDLNAALTKLLVTEDGGFVLRTIPTAKTSPEMTRLLEASEHVRAKEFLEKRADKVQAKDLDRELKETSSWEDLIDDLLAKAERHAPFSYPAFSGKDALLQYMCTREFLHFEPPPTMVFSAA